MMSVDDFAASRDYSSHAMTSDSSGRVSSADPQAPSGVRAFAPGSIGNLGPGLDILGCAVTGPGDAVVARFHHTAGIHLIDAGHPELPRDPEHHASAIAAAEVLRRANAISVGLSLTVEKGLPLSGGQGGSAASAIAGAFAVNELIGRPLSRNELLLAALVAEQRVAGRHLDNLAPALLGGAVLVRSIEPLDVVRLPTPLELRFVVVHPDMRLRTADARAVLPTSVDLSTAMSQASAIAKMVWALASGDVEQLRGTIDDRIAEPARARLLPGFAAAKQAAIDAGALGCSIAGGGPSSFAMVNGDGAAERTLDAMLAAYQEAGVNATGRVARVDDRGTRLEPVQPTTPTNPT
jgi:homoserine kinase